MRNLRRVSMLFMLAALFASLAGCGLTQIRKTEDRLSIRIKDYWSARLAKDYEKSYEYESELTRKLKTFDMYYADFFTAKSELLEYEIVDMKYNAEKDLYNVKVKKKLILQVPEFTGLNLNNMQEETWKFENGDWYREYVEKKSPLFGKGKKKQ